MSGYKNYAMSNNAVTAYAAGEMPLSKWSKAAIIKAVKTDIIEPQFDLELLQKLTLAVVIIDNFKRRNY